MLNKCMFVNIFKNTQIHTICTYMHMCTYMHIYAYVHINAYMYMHRYAYIHIDIKVGLKVSDAQSKNMHICSGGFI